MPSTTDLHDRIERDFTNHPPVEDRIIEVFEDLREVAKAFAHDVVDMVPQSREQSLALTLINQALFEAVAGVARNQEAALALIDGA